MPEPPTSAVNGQVVGSPAAHNSMSMLSLEPAATTFVWAGSIVTAGSFCLFCEKSVLVLPTDTSTSPTPAAAGIWIIAGTATRARPSRMPRPFDLMTPPSTGVWPDPSPPPGSCHTANTVDLHSHRTAGQGGSGTCTRASQEVALGENTWGRSGKSSLLRATVHARLCRSTLPEGYVFSDPSRGHRFVFVDQ